MQIVTSTRSRPEELTGDRLTGCLTLHRAHQKKAADPRAASSSTSCIGLLRAMKRCNGVWRAIRSRRTSNCRSFLSRARSRRAVPVIGAGRPTQPLNLLARALFGNSWRKSSIASPQRAALPPTTVQKFFPSPRQDDSCK